MHIAVLGSGSGTVLEALLRAQRSLKNQAGSPLFQVKALFTDRKCRFQEISERERIPLVYHSFVDFFKEKGIDNHQDTLTRQAYDQKSVELIEGCASQGGFFLDLIFLAGYSRLLHAPFLQHYKNKIINAHPSDLTLLNANGTRKYVGASAVLDALMAGETRTRTSVILIDEDVDRGPVLVSGPWLPYTGGPPVTAKKAANHQERQKQLSDWPACVKAAELIACGRLSIDSNRRIFLDGLLQNQGGYVMERCEAMEYLEGAE